MTSKSVTFDSIHVTFDPFHEMAVDYAHGDGDYLYVGKYLVDGAAHYVCSRLGGNSPVYAAEFDRHFREFMGSH